MSKLDTNFVKQLYSSKGVELTPEKLQYISENYASNEELESSFNMKYAEPQEPKTDPEKKNQNSTTTSTKTPSVSPTQQRERKPTSVGGKPIQTGASESSAGKGKEKKSFEDTKVIYINKDSRRGEVDDMSTPPPAGYRYEVVQNSAQLKKWKEQKTKIKEESLFGEPIQSFTEQKSKEFKEAKKKEITVIDKKPVVDITSQFNVKPKTFTEAVSTQVDNNFKVAPVTPLSVVVSEKQKQRKAAQQEGLDNYLTKESIDFEDALAGKGFLNNVENFARGSWNTALALASNLPFGIGEKASEVIGSTGVVADKTSVDKYFNKAKQEFEKEGKSVTPEQLKEKAKEIKLKEAKDNYIENQDAEFLNEIKDEKYVDPKSGKVIKIQDALRINDFERYNTLNKESVKYSNLLKLNKEKVDGFYNDLKQTKNVLNHQIIFGNFDYATDIYNGLLNKEDKNQDDLDFISYYETNKDKAASSPINPNLKQIVSKLEEEIKSKADDFNSVLDTQLNYIEKFDKSFTGKEDAYEDFDNSRRSYDGVFGDKVYLSAAETVNGTIKTIQTLAELSDKLKGKIGLPLQGADSYLFNKVFKDYNYYDFSKELGKQKELLREDVKEVTNASSLLNYWSDVTATQSGQMILPMLAGYGKVAMPLLRQSAVYFASGFGRGVGESEEFEERFKRGLVEPGEIGKVHTFAEKLIHGGITGGADVLGNLPTALRLSKSFNSLLSKPETANIFWKSWTKKGLDEAKELRNDLLKENTEESLAEIFQDLSRVFVLNEDGVNIGQSIDDVIKDTTTFTLISKIFPLMGRGVINRIASTSDKNKISELEKELYYWKGKLGENVSEETKAIYSDRISKIQSNIDKTNLSIINKVKKDAGGVNAIESLNIEIDNTLQEANKINENKELSKEEKKVLLDAQKELYTSLISNRDALIDGSKTSFDLLPEEQQTKFKTDAAEAIIQEQVDKGIEKDKIQEPNAEVINKKAKELYNQKIQEDAKTKQTDGQITSEEKPTTTTEEQTVGTAQQVDAGVQTQEEVTDYKEISKRILDKKELNTIRASLRASSPDSLVLEVLDAISKGNVLGYDSDLDLAIEDMIENGVSINNIANLILEDDVIAEKKGVNSKRKAIDYALNIGAKGTILKAGQQAVLNQPKTQEDAVQEQITNEGVLQPGQSEMELQGLEQRDTKQEVVTKQGEEKVNTKISDPYTSIEVDRVKALPIESEDGATMNLDGSKYEDGGLVIPLASKNMNASELTPEAIQSFVDENAESVGADNVKVGIYKFPNSNQVSIDINIVADPSVREEAIAIGKELGQESLFDLDTFENVKTGSDGMNPKKLTPTEFKEIQQRLKPKSKGIEVAKDINQAKKQVANISDKKIAKAVLNGVKAISKILPNVKVIIHDTDASFRSVSGESKNQESSGLYINGEIHINLPKANRRTVAHEIFHAILLDKVKTDANAQTVTKKMIESIASKIEGNPTLKTKLEDFASMYDENIQDEEKLAELVGMLAENYESFSARVKEIIKNWLNNIAKSFGVELFETNEVFDVLNTIAKRVATGKEISKKDISKVIPSDIDKYGNLRKPSELSINNLNNRKQKIVDEVKSKVIEGNIVSTRLPKKNDVHSNKDYIVSLKSLESEAIGDKKIQEQYIKIAKEISSYDISKTKNVENFDDAKKLVNDFKNSVKSNLKWLYNSFGNDVRDVSKLWYDGANVISNDIALKYNYSLEQVAGVMAVLSPQMDWFRNLSLGERVIDIYSNQKESIFDSKMIEYINNATTGTGKNKLPLFKDSKDIISRVKGKKLLELDNKDKAYFIRVFDEVYNPRQYNNISPNGKVNGLVRKSDGTPGACGWGAFSTIEKSISILENGSIENISSNLGNMHKVRNFFNNISNPNDLNAVTIDTHAVAAALLLPLSGSSKQVLYNFGGAGNVNTGMTGTYPVYADAYRELASELGLLPREVQSITWEAVRGLFKATFKTDKNNELKINEVWKDYSSGLISLSKAHSDIESISGGISKPVWFEYLADDNLESLDKNSAAVNQANLDNEKEDITIRQQKVLPAKVSEKLTDDGDGNFVFKHYSDQKRDVIKKGQGNNAITSREEASALSAVGGLAMFYTMEGQKETGVGNVEHNILIPKDKVYDIDSDPLGFEGEARKRFNQVRPGQAFTNNHRGAFITQIANENGFDVAVTQWRGSELRAQTTKELTPSDKAIDFKERPLDTFKDGDYAIIDGRESLITNVDGNKLRYESLDGLAKGTTINNERNRRSIIKIDKPSVRMQKPKKLSTQINKVVGVKPKATEQKRINKAFGLGIAEQKIETEAQKQKTKLVKDELSELNKQFKDVVSALNKVRDVEQREKLEKQKEKIQENIDKIKNNFKIELSDIKDQFKDIFSSTKDVLSIEKKEALEKQKANLQEKAKNSRKRILERKRAVNELKKKLNDFVSSSINGLDAGDIGKRAIISISKKVQSITEKNFEEKLKEVNSILDNLYTNRDVNTAKTDSKKAFKNVMSGKVGKLDERGDRDKVMSSKVVNFTKLEPKTLKKVLDDADFEQYKDYIGRLSGRGLTLSETDLKAIGELYDRISKPYSDYVAEVNRIQQIIDAGGTLTKGESDFIENNKSDFSERETPETLADKEAKKSERDAKKEEEIAKKKASIKELLPSIKSVFESSNAVKGSLEWRMLNSLIGLSESDVDSMPDNMLTNALNAISSMVNDDVIPAYAEDLYKYKLKTDYKNALVETLKKSGKAGVYKLKVAKIPLKFREVIGLPLMSLIKGINQKNIDQQVIDRRIKFFNLSAMDAAVKVYGDTPLFNAFMSSFGKAMSRIASTEEKVEAVLLKAKIDLDKNSKNPQESYMKIVYHLIDTMAKNNVGTTSSRSAMEYFEATVSDPNSKISEDNYMKGLVQGFIDKVGANNNQIDDLTPEEANAANAIRMVLEENQINAYEANFFQNSNAAPMIVEYYPVFNSVVKQAENDLARLKSKFGIDSVSIKAGSLEDKTGKAHPIDLNPFTSAFSSVRNVLFQHQLRSEYAAITQAINEAIAENSKDNDVLPYLKGIQKALNSQFDLLINGAIHTEPTLTDKILNGTDRAFYTLALGSIISRGVDFAGNMVQLMTINPKYISYSNKVSNALMNIKENGESETELIRNFYENAEASDVNKMISSKKINTERTEFINKGINKEVLSKGLPSSNVGLKIKTNITGPIRDTASGAVDTLLGFGDVKPYAISWNGVFYEEFLKQTREDVNVEKIARGDVEYLKKYKDAISKASNKANQENADLYGSTNPMEKKVGIMEIASKQVKNSVPGAVNALVNKAAYLFASFDMNARNDMNTAVNTYIENKEGRNARRFLGGAIRLASYSLAINYITGAIWEFFKGDDDDEEKLKVSFDKLSGDDDFIKEVNNSLLDYPIQKDADGNIIELTREDLVKYNKMRDKLMQNKDFAAAYDIVYGYVNRDLFDNQVKNKIGEINSGKYEYDKSLVEVFFSDMDKGFGKSDDEIIGVLGLLNSQQGYKLFTQDQIDSYILKLEKYMSDTKFLSNRAIRESNKQIDRLIITKTASILSDYRSNKSIGDITTTEGLKLFMGMMLSRSNNFTKAAYNYAAELSNKQLIQARRGERGYDAFKDNVFQTPVKAGLTEKASKQQLTQDVFNILFPALTKMDRYMATDYAIPDLVRFTPLGILGVNDFSKIDSKMRNDVIYQNTNGKYRENIIKDIEESKIDILRSKEDIEKDSTDNQFRKSRVIPGVKETQLKSRFPSYKEGKDLKVNGNRAN